MLIPHRAARSRPAAGRHRRVTESEVIRAALEQYFSGFQSDEAPDPGR